jgi:nucleolar protein 6
MQQSAEQQPVVMNFSFSTKKRKKGAAISQQQQHQQPASDTRAVARDSALKPLQGKHIARNDNAASSTSDTVEANSRAHKKARACDPETASRDSKKQKKSSAAKVDEANAPAQAGDSGTAAKAKRFTLFVGNMPFNISDADVRQHFSQCSVVGCRLLRNKVTAVGKGTAFLDFSDSKGFLAALKLHHSLLGGRQINVEPTAGGGGNGTNRIDKIESKKKRLEKVIKGSAGGGGGGAGGGGSAGIKNGSAARSKFAAKNRSPAPSGVD